MTSNEVVFKAYEINIKSEIADSFFYVDSLFGDLSAAASELDGERVVRLSLEKVHPYKDNPYGIRTTSPNILL